MDRNSVKPENIAGHKTSESFLDKFKQFICRNVGYFNQCENYNTKSNCNLEEVSDDNNIQIGNNNFSVETKDEDNLSLFKFEECEDIPVENIPITKLLNSNKKLDKTASDTNTKDTEVIDISSDDECFDIKLDKDDDTISYHSSDFEFIQESEAKDHGLYKRVTNYKHITEYFDQGLCNENHKIPDGNEYLELFQGKYTPYPTLGMENKSTRARNSAFMEYNGIGFNMHVPTQKVSDEMRNEALLNANLIRNMYPAENTRRRRHHAR